MWPEIQLLESTTTTWRRTSLKILRSQQELSDKFKSISIFPDISTVTIVGRKVFSPFTKILRGHNIPYKCSFPVKLIVFCENSQIVCQDPGTIRDALTTWNLLSTHHSSPKQGKLQKSAMISPLWSERSRHTRSTNPDWTPPVFGRPLLYSFSMGLSLLSVLG